jgi:soluble lytic murein transglycosylase
MARWALAGALLLGGCGERAPAVVEPEASVSTPTATRATAPTLAATATAKPPAPTRDAPAPQVVPEPLSWPTCFELVPGQSLRAQAASLWDAGDYDTLTTLLRAEQGAAADVAGAVEICLARVALADGDLSGGAALLLPWAQVEGELQHQALALLLDTYERAREWQGAALAGEMLLTLNPPGATQVAWRTARVLVQMGESSRALALLKGLDVTNLPPGSRAQVLEETARLARESNQWELSLALLDEILSFAVQPAYRALIEVERARTLATISEYDEAIAALNAVLTTHGSSVAGQQALSVLNAIAEQNPELKEAKVHPALEARVLLFSGQNEGALRAARKSLDYRDVDRAEAFTLIGLALAAQGSTRLAVAEYDRAITLYSQRKRGDDELSEQRLAEVWFAKAEAVAANKGDPSKVYALFASRYADHVDAPRALQLAAQYLDTGEQPARAAEAFAQVVAKHPASQQASTAAFAGGLALYRAGEIAKAGAAWEAALGLLAETPEGGAATATDLARIEVWAGITRRAGGDLVGALEIWRTAADRDPDGYWGLRANDLIAGAALRLPLESAALPIATPTDWTAIEAWMAPWGGQPLSEADGALVEAGAWLWRVGWESDATSLLSGLANQRRDDAPLLAQIARRSEAEGIWAVSTLAAERLMQAGRAAGALEAPDDLWRVAYPLPYADLVQENAAQYGLDPLLFEALLRQESRFYARATSHAGARGLAQVMPSTGAWIAEKIGPESYRDALLYRPYVSLRYGAWYLNYGLTLRERDWPAALVAYNAGPGNLANWTAGEPVSDYDLFAATMPVAEPRAYVTGVYRQYRLYQRLYR